MLWVVSGTYFSLVPIKTVRGEDMARKVQAPALTADQPFFPLEQVLRVVHDEGPPAQIHLRLHLGKPSYAVFYQEEIPTFLLDAFSGQRLPDLTPEEAAAAALADYREQASVVDVQMLAQAPAEYKGPLPVYRVALDDARDTRLYLSPVTGEIIKRRNRYWRIFDFLWMLHIMDYQERTNFNNNLLRFMSIMGLITVASGYALWATSRRHRGRRKDVQTA